MRYEDACERTPFAEALKLPTQLDAGAVACATAPRLFDSNWPVRPS